jgi:CubicO group peptidase (beta-lactamase class C family)
MKRVVALMLLGLAGAGVSLTTMAQPSTSVAPAIPQTVLGQRLSEWLDQCRAPNREAFAAWARAHAPGLQQDAEQRDLHFELCRDNGPFNLMKVPRSDDRSLTAVIASEASLSWWTLRFEREASGKLALAVMPSLPPESFWQGRLSDADIARQHAQLVRHFVDRGAFSGISIVERGGQMIGFASGGYADRARSIPFTPATRFTIGSMGKMFTAVAIGQLIEARKLSVNDTVGKFFPAYPNAAVRDKVTVGMLLSHTSGLGDFLDKRTAEMMKNGIVRAADLMPLYQDDALLFAPGTRWEYSNAGFALAGAIVEKLSGKTYADYVRDHIFRVARMADSDPNNIPAITNLVVPYTKEGPNGARGDMHVAQADIGTPAGGAISSGRDLVRFARALNDGTLVSAQTLAEMKTSRTVGMPAPPSGYGMQLLNLYGQEVAGHGGGFPGVSANLLMVGRSPTSVITLSNFDPPASDNIAMPIATLLAARASHDKIK